MEIIIKENAKKMLADKLTKNQFLRVGVTEGGCAGLTYSAEISDTIQDGESIVLESGSIRIVAHDESTKYLNGLTIDYSDDLINGGLKFTNANTKSTCGCGQSFNLTGFPIISDPNCGK